MAKVRGANGDDKVEVGCWLGKTDRADFHMVATAKGLKWTRTIRRLPSRILSKKLRSVEGRQGCLKMRQLKIHKVETIVQALQRLAVWRLETTHCYKICWIAWQSPNMRTWRLRRIEFRRREKKCARVVVAVAGEISEDEYESLTCPDHPSELDPISLAKIEGAGAKEEVERLVVVGVEIPLLTTKCWSWTGGGVKRSDPNRTDVFAPAGSQPLLRMSKMRISCVVSQRK